ncbi:MAG: hypothetical protein RLZZ176_3190 [Cyanobacteriota bacterium]|jgi:hypothetical protein
MKPFIYMGYGVNKLIFGIIGTEEPEKLGTSDRETVEQIRENPYLQLGQ